MSEHAQLPTLGDLTKAIIDFTGLLAQKNNSSQVIHNETAKKSIQSQLLRLAKEDSELNKNLSELIELLNQLLIDSLKDRRLVNVISNSIEEIFVQYKDYVRDRKSVV